MVNLMLMRSYLHPMYQIARTRSDDELVEAMIGHPHSEVKVLVGDDKYRLIQISRLHVELTVTLC